MRARPASVIFIACLVAAMLTALPGPTARAQSPVPVGVNVDVKMQISPPYDVYGYGYSQVSVVITSATPLGFNQSDPVTLSPSFIPTTLSITANFVNGSSESLPYALPTGTFGVFIDFVIPVNASSFTVTMQGTQSGSSFLWRYVSITPTITVGTGLFVNSTNAVLVLPRSTEIAQAYSGTAQVPVPAQLSPSNQTSVTVQYDISGFVGSVLVMQSTLFLPLSIAVTTAVLVIIVVAAVSLSSKGRSLTSQLRNGLQSRLSSLSKPVRRFAPISREGVRSIFQPRKLLILFVICSLLMVSVAALAGPDPRFKAYVIADPQDASSISKSLSTVVGRVVVITPAQDYSDFGVMSSVGEFNLVVVSGYPGTILPAVSDYVLPNLGNVPAIVYDNSANMTFVNQIVDLYGSSKVLHVADAGNLTTGERSQLASLLGSTSAKRTNELGLKISSTGFEGLLAAEGVLSFVLIFLGFAYLGSLTSEAFAKSDVSHLVTVVTSGILVFVFSEVIYVVTSTLLAVPLSLHAVITGAKDITAVGLLGFGGGSTPRLISGFLGVVVGATVVDGGVKIKVTDASLVTGAIVILLLNPLSLGEYVFQGLMNWVGPTTGARFSFGIASANTASLKSFLYGIGDFFGGGVSPQYLLSAGKIFYFSGLVPLAYLKKMGRTTSILALLLIGGIMGQGGIRVGEMTPDKTVIAIVPGIIAGFAFAALLLALALLEKYARGSWKT
ncbi:MAG TPA: hypothetical protein VEJ36_06245 [Nitrososphaerales archaeon]|nr:hypothetical protein [Nitrososphaerales archaeon]